MSENKESSIFDANLEEEAPVKRNNTRRKGVIIPLKKAEELRDMIEKSLTQE